MEPAHFQIKIKTLDNALHELEVSSNMKVKNLKILIEEKMKIPIPKQRLIFHGRLLSDDEDSLSKFKIEEGHVLHLVANPLEAPTITRSQSSSAPQNHPNASRNQNTANDIDILTGIIRSINQTSINRRNLRRRIMQQRTNGFNLDLNESLSVIKQSFQSLNMVMENTTKFSEIASIKNLSKNTFINPFNFSNRKLLLGQWIDVKDTIDQWLEAQIIKVHGNQVFVHYNGWGNRWDEWLDMNSPRIALFRTFTVQSSHSVFLSPNPINQPDGEINESINEPKIEAQDLLFDLSSMLNKITASIIDLAKMMNTKKMQESNPSFEEEVKMNVSEDMIPNEIKISLLNSQLAPIFDRVGRLMIDLAPHLAIEGCGIQTIYVPQQNASVQLEDQKTLAFQVPIMLTPGEILSINSGSDRTHADELPRNTIIIGSRSLAEHSNRNEEEERTFQRQEHSQNSEILSPQQMEQIGNQVESNMQIQEIEGGASGNNLYFGQPSENDNIKDQMENSDQRESSNQNHQNENLIEQKENIPQNENLTEHNENITQNESYLDQNEHNEKGENNILNENNVQKEESQNRDSQDCDPEKNP